MGRDAIRRGGMILRDTAMASTTVIRITDMAITAAGITTRGIQDIALTGGGNKRRLNAVERPVDRGLAKYG